MLDNMKKKLLQEKLMKVTPIRLNENLDIEIASVAKAVGESKQTVIRLAIKEGLRIVERKLAPQKNNSKKGA